MSFARQAAIFILAPLLSLFLLLLVISGSIGRVAQPEGVKQILDDSGLYESVVPSLLELSREEGGEGEISLSDPVVKNAFESTFSGAFLEQSAEEIVDGVAAWLNGETAKPQFSIDMAAKKKEFASAVSQELRKKLDGLPRCSSAVTASSFDVFSATCLPMGVTAASAADQAEQEILSEEGLFKDPVITADDFKGEGSQESVFSSEGAPENFQKLKSAPVYLAILAMLTAAGIILLSRPWQKGLRRVGWILIGSGIAVVILAWIINFIITKVAAPAIQVDSPALQEDLRNLVTDVVDSVSQNYWIFGGIYLALGILAIAAAIFISRRSVSAPDSEINKSPDEPAGTKTKTTGTSRPRKDSLPAKETDRSAGKKPD